MIDWFLGVILILDYVHDKYENISNMFNMKTYNM